MEPKKQEVRSPVEVVAFQPIVQECLEVWDAREDTVNPQIRACRVQFRNRLSSAFVVKVQTVFWDERGKFADVSPLRSMELKPGTITPYYAHSPEGEAEGRMRVVVRMGYESGGEEAQGPMLFLYPPKK